MGSRRGVSVGGAGDPHPWPLSLRGRGEGSDKREYSVVVVREPLSEESSFFSVEGHMVPEYRADELTDLDDAKRTYKDLFYHEVGF